MLFCNTIRQIMNRNKAGALFTQTFKHHPINLHSVNELHRSASSSFLERDHIRLLTYNLYMRPPPVKTNASDHKDDRLKEYVKLLDHYDIICN